LGKIVAITLVETAGLFCLASRAFLYLDALDSDDVPRWLPFLGASLMGGGLFVLLRSESMKQATTFQRCRTFFVVIGVSLILTLTTFAVLAKVLRRNWPGDKIRPLEAVNTAPAVTAGVAGEVWTVERLLSESSNSASANDARPQIRLIGVEWRWTGTAGIADYIFRLHRGALFSRCMAKAPQSPSVINTTRKGGWKRSHSESPGFRASGANRGGSTPATRRTASRLRRLQLGASRF
jgi:hypothetical protein